MQNKLKYLFYVDLALAVATIGYGVLSSSPWVVGAGVAGLALALLKPAHRIVRLLERKFLSKTPVAVPALDTRADAVPGPASAVDFSRNPPYYSAVRPMRNPHNALHAPGVVDFTATAEKPGRWQ